MKAFLNIRTIHLLLVVFFACSCSSNGLITKEQDISDNSVAVVNNTEITYQELQNAYTQNIEDTVVTRDQLIDFLPSYIDYRLKLLEGKNLGYQFDQELLDEFETFARQAASGYWLENDIKKERIDNFIDRSKYELKANHILIEADDGISTRQQNEILSKLSEAKNKLETGEDPQHINLEYSSEREGRPMGGQLPWITAGRTVQPFEDALYSLKPGEVSDPVRTQFGFHVIQLEGKRERNPDRLTSHIFIAKQENENAKQLIKATYDSLEAGMSWTEAVNYFTQDRRSVQRSGQIGWIGYGMQFPAAFVDEVMKTDSALPYSKPIEMDYGYHILKVDSVRTLKTREKEVQYAEQELERIGRLQPSKADMIERVKEVGELSIKRHNLDSLLQSLLSEDYEIEIMEGLPLFTLNNEEYTAAQFLNYLETSAEQSNNNTNYYLRFDEYINDVAESNLIDITKKHFPAYREQMNMFLDGLIVFKVNEELLWDADKADEEILQNHFKMNRDSYSTNKTIKYTRIGAPSDSLIRHASKLFNNGIPPDELENSIDQLDVRSGSIANPDSDLFQTLNNMSAGDVTEINNTGSWHQFYILDEIIPSRLMTYEEAKSSVFNDILPEHEKKVMQHLKEKYSATLYPQHIR